ncbi:MAG: hypothetical protein KDD68_18715, partial [Bdellovibrionales bacterium]|nr:hypothetical protein [Bdellovibrionales bacterium]
MGRLIKLLCLTIVIGSFVAEAKDKVRTIEVQGHRGARAIYPENTLAGFEYALGLGVDTLELDLAVTRGNVLVVSHDPFLNPAICLGPKGKKLDPEKKILIRQLTFDELQKYDCGTLKHPGFAKQKPVPGQRIPRLSQVFEMVKNSKLPQAKSVKFNIETKIVPAYAELTPSPEEFARLVVELVKSYDLISRVTIQSFDDRTLVAAKKLEPKIKTALLIAYNHVDMLALAKSIGAEIISPNHEWILESDVKTLQR